MQSEIVKLRNEKLIGDWHHSDSAKQLVVICHGYKSSSANSTLVAITKDLNKYDYDTFTFNFSENLSGFDVEHQVKDITLIAEHFKNYDEIILLAYSFGALTAAIATIHIPIVKGLITLNGFFGQNSLGQKHYRNYVKFRAAALMFPKYTKIRKYYKKELRPDLIEVPVLVIHSKGDKTVFVEQSQSFYKKLTHAKQYLELPTADHDLALLEDRKKVISEINDWLKTYGYKTK
jgi:alpha-beta hydrolase superfamily lysophospholipase